MKRLILSVLACLLITGTSHGDTYEADLIPWSGYWWSTLNGGLVTGMGYNGSPSPLQKYELAFGGTVWGPAVTYGREFYYNTDAVFWEGLCFNWAVASVMEPEPVKRGIYNDVLFNIGDKKGLLTVAYHGALYNQTQFEGPVDFHRALEEFIREQRKPVIMDLGSQELGIWYYPVFKYETAYQTDGNIRRYETTIYYADDSVEPDFIGTQVRSSTYFYYFVTNGAGEITDSGWDEVSKDNPPLNATEAYGTEPKNPGIEYNRVVTIAQADDDIYEENDSFQQASPISNGSYDILAIDSDFFSLDMNAGDSLDIAIREEIANTISITVFDPENNIAGEGVGSLASPAEATSSGRYFIQLAPVDPAEQPYGTMMVSQKLPFQSILPVNSPGLWDTGVAILNTDGQVSRMILTMVDTGGVPLRDASMPFSGTHILGTLRHDFGLTRTDPDGYLKLDSDTKLVSAGAITDLKTLFGGMGFVSEDEAASELYYHYFHGTNLNLEIEYGMINIGSETEEIDLDFYGEDGTATSTDTITLQPGAKTIYNSTSIGDANMRASASSRRNCLVGYMEFTGPWLFHTQKAYVEMAGETNLEIIVPHVAATDGWYTVMCVMNTGAMATRLTFTVYNGNGDVVGQENRNVNPKQGISDRLPDMFPDIAPDQVASVRIASDTSLIRGYLLYGLDTGSHLAGIPMSNAISSEVILPHIASGPDWGTGVAIMNLGGASDGIVFSLFDGNGAALRETTRNLNPNQRIAITIRDLFQNDVPADARYLQVVSPGGQPLIGLFKMLSLQPGYQWLWGGIIK